MNCDDVFLILTRGPFPAGTSQDAAVEAHLQWCAACQRLAEALRPGHDLLQESVSPEESRALPGYRGEAVGAPRDLAVSLTHRSESARLNPQRKRLEIGWFRLRHLNIWEFAAAIALGIVLAVALRTLVAPAQHPWRSAGVAAGAASAENRRGADADRRMLVLRDLPVACRPDLGISPALTAGLDKPPSLVAANTSLAENCCTQCHRAGSDMKMSPVAMRQLQQSCRACHE